MPQDEYDENELLWEMGRRAADNGSADLPEHELVAYREGRLSKEDAESCERRLGRSPAARARLAELAAPESVAPPPYVRDRVLASFDTTSQRSALAYPPAPMCGSLLKAAAIAVVGIGMLLLMRLSIAPPSPEPLPADLAYEVAAEGLATVRESVPGSREVEAYPGTRVRITASPRSAAVKEIAFGIYRESAARLERIGVGSGLEIETFRGAARVTAEARDLAFPDAETTRLYLVAARPGDLPATVEIGEATGAAALEEAGRRRAYPVVIHLRPLPAAP